MDNRATSSFFEMAKEALQMDTVLVHFDEKKPIVLTCDASPYGIRAVLSHTTEDGSDRPIAYASWSLTTTGKGYAQLEKEALAISLAPRNPIATCMVVNLLSNRTINHCPSCSAKTTVYLKRPLLGCRGGHWLVHIRIQLHINQEPCRWIEQVTPPIQYIIWLPSRGNDSSTWTLGNHKAGSWRDQEICRERPHFISG